MAIRIKLSTEANAILFEGSSAPSYFNGILTASVATGSLINIENVAASTGSSTVYEYYNYDYNNFEDATGSAFLSAQAAVDYINEKANQPAVFDNIQGYLGLLSGYYYGGSSTTMSVELADVNTYLDVPFEIHPSGTFDYRPQVMKSAQPLGYDTGSGLFTLEGLDLSTFGAFRSSLSFDPDEDDGLLEGRIVFQRHSGSIPSSDFSISSTITPMPDGAAVDYEAEPYLSFFVGDTIDTNAPGDAGTFKFQIRSNVPGILSLRALTLYINR